MSSQTWWLGSKSYRTSRPIVCQAWNLRKAMQVRPQMPPAAPGMVASPWLSSPRFQRLPNVDNDPVKDPSNRQKTLQKAKACMTALLLLTPVSKSWNVGS